MHPISTTTVFKYINSYSTILIVASVDNCESLVRQCQRTKTDFCEQSRCIRGVYKNVAQCRSDSRYRKLNMLAIMNSLSNYCSRVSLKYLG